MSQRKVLRILLTTDEGSVGAIFMTLSGGERKILQTQSLGGANRELLQLSLGSGPAKFREGLMEARFHGKYNASMSADLERYLQKVVRNLDFVDRLYDALEKNRKNDLNFLFTNELQVVLGSRDIKFAHAYEPLDGESGSEEVTDRTAPAEAAAEAGAEAAEASAFDQARYVPLSFSLSPLGGTPMNELLPGDEVFVRVVDAKHPLAEAFLEFQNALRSEEEGTASADEYPAKLIELKPNPQGGFFALVQLPEGSEGLIVEPEAGIRVKRPAVLDDRVVLQGPHAESSGTGAPAVAAGRGRAVVREEVPLIYVLAFAGAAIALAGLLLMLL